MRFFIEFKEASLTVSDGFRIRYKSAPELCSFILSTLTFEETVLDLF